MPLPKQEKIADLNWTLTEYDRMIDVILSNLTAIKEELHGKDNKKEKIAADYHDILSFKIEATYSLLLKLEELFFDTTFAYYRKYHGAVRGEVNFVEFDNIKREAGYIFDSFLSEYKSLLDLTVKFASEFIFSNLDNISIDSFEKMVGIIADNKLKLKNVRKKLEASGKFDYFKKILGNFIVEKISLEEIKDYRDYIIHHSYVRHQLTGKSTEGHIAFSYSIPRLIKKGVTYEIDNSSSTRLDYFCRTKLYLLLSLIAEMTDLLYSEDFKQPYITKLSTFSPEVVKEVLLKISMRQHWADKVVDEEGLKELLREKGIDMSELIEESIYREEDKKKGNKEKNLLPPMEKIQYKPIGNIRVFRNRLILNELKTLEKSTRERLEKPTYGVMFSSITLKDFVYQNPALADILDTLHRSGLVYVVKTKDEIRYASAKEELEWLIYSLKELTDFKWSFIQVPEMKYFRPRTQEETKNMRRILGEKTDEFLKKEDEEKERIQKEYAEWKREPVHYFENFIDVVDKEKKSSQE